MDDIDTTYEKLALLTLADYVEHADAAQPTHINSSRFQTMISEYCRSHNLAEIRFNQTKYKQLGRFLSYLASKKYVSFSPRRRRIDAVLSTKYLGDDNNKSAKGDEKTMIDLTVHNQENISPNVSIGTEKLQTCPVCSLQFKPETINPHLDECLSLKLLQEEQNKDNTHNIPIEREAHRPSLETIGNMIEQKLIDYHLKKRTREEESKSEGPKIKKIKLRDIAFDQYNVQVLKEPIGEIECSICLEEFTVGQKMAMLPCLCYFHDRCIESWFQKNRQCPIHMTAED